MKRLLSITIIVVIFSLMLTQAVAIETEEISSYDDILFANATKLSSLSEAECIVFIKQNGIAIPEDYEYDTLGTFIKQIIETVEKNPDCEFYFNYTKTQQFANNIKSLVLEYYNYTTSNNSFYDFSNATSTNAASSYTLQDSVAAVAWSEMLTRYNCYIYSIGIPELIFVDPGAFSTHDFSLNLSLAEMADRVIWDLEALGHQRVTTINSQNLGNLCRNEQIICMRRGAFDYHFMKLDNNAWYHKPGSTLILRYLYTPTVVRLWTNEHIIVNTAYEGNITYDSDIIYISYNGHDWSYSSTSSNTHTRTCTICNHTETLNCNYKYTYLYDDMHNATCVDCGNTIPGGNCSFTYTSNNNGTHTGVCVCGNTRTATCYAGSYTSYSNGTHRKNCSQCGYNMGSENCTYTCTYLDSDTHSRQCVKCGTTADPSACSYSYKYHGSVNGQNTHVEICAGCAHIKSGPTQCSYIGSKPCRFCGTPKGGSVLNSLEEDFSEN